MTLNELIQDFKDEGLSFNEPIRFFAGRGYEVFLASVYQGGGGSPIIDLEDENA